MNPPDQAVTRAATAPSRARLPWQLAASAVAWVLSAIVLGVAWLSLGGSPAADEQAVGQIRGALGDSAVDLGPVSSPVPSVALLVVAVLLVLLAAGLATGRGWTRYPAVGLAVVGVMLLALAGRWETVAAMVLLVVGMAPLLFPTAHRHLSAERSSAGCDESR